MDNYEAVSDSGSSDCEHIGNSIACRFYNREGCNRGTQCKFSHGPDDKSIRDDLGKNVCIFAVVGCCQFGSERCIYSHDASFLPEKGWWNDSGILKELRDDVYLGRSIKSCTEKYIVEMIHGHLYDAGYGPPRNLEAILDRSILGHTAHKQEKTSESQGSPPKDNFVMFIALDHSNSFQELYTRFFDAVRTARLETRIVSSASAALDLMYSPYLRGIFIADAGITEHKYIRLANTIVEYTKNGGITVYGGIFPAVAKWSEMASHFERVWNVPWRPGLYTYETLKRNDRNETASLNPSLPSSYRIKAFYIHGIAPKDAMYTAQGLTGEAPVVHVKCGKGYLGYSGEESATQSVLAMLGLLDHVYDPPPLNPNKKPIPTPPKPPPTFSQNFVLLISLVCEPWFPDMYGHVYSALRQKVRIKQALTAETALSYLKAPELVGIFVTDFGIADTMHSGLLKQVVQYAKDGGLVVAAGQFSGRLCGPNDRHFFQAWGLSWKGDSYHRTTFQKNPANELVKLNPSLPQSYSMKALHMANIGQDSAVYVPTSDSRPESLVWAPTPITNHEEAPAVQFRIGRGYFGYIGDVNTEEATTSVLLAMLGLLDHKYDSRKDPSHSNSPSASRNDTSIIRSRRPKQTARKTASLTQPAFPETGRSSSGTRIGTIIGQNRPQTARKSASLSQPIPVESGVAVILVISLGDEDIYNSERQLLFNRLDRESRVIRASTATVALQNLSSPDLIGVLINEPSIANIASYADVLNRVIAFAKDGGTVVFGGSFSSLASARLHDEFWQAKMGIKWTCGSYRKGVVNIVRKHEMFSACSWLQSGFTMHAAHLKFADQNSALYCGNDNTNEAAVLRTRYGQGYVGYVGDIHGEQESVEITLAMLDVIVGPLPRQEFAIGYAVVG
ncbi:transcription factor [Moniliophthora roreri MCA 2997]|nr:transcription factor [Moniliophthora roreri MCA 2997]